MLSGNGELQDVHEHSQSRLLILSACQRANGAFLGFLQTAIVPHFTLFIDCPEDDSARHVLGRNQEHM